VLKTFDHPRDTPSQASFAFLALLAIVAHIDRIKRVGYSLHRSYGAVHCNMLNHKISSSLKPGCMQRSDKVRQLPSFVGARFRTYPWFSSREQSC
jgi:hypothetical protein